MSFVLELSGNESILRADYFPSIILDEDHEIALLSFQGWNSMANITPENNKFYYTVGNKHQIVQVETGSYEITDIEKYLQRALRPEHLKNPLKPEQKQETSILLSGNNSTFRTEIISRYPIDFTKPQNIGQVLGFSDKQKCEPFKRCSSQDTIKILSVETIDLHCNLIKNSYYNDQKSQILHQVCILEPPGYKVNEMPSNLIYLPLTTREISSVVLSLRDQAGKLIDFRKEHINIRLHLRKIKK